VQVDTAEFEEPDEFDHDDADSNDMWSSDEDI
jgi:hypothetical protein